MASSLWVEKAVLFEVLSVGLRFTTHEVAQALVDGEYAASLLEALQSCDIASGETDEEVSGLDVYVGDDADRVFHAVRREHTRLFTGAPSAVVSPYAGVHHAQDVGVTPVLFVNSESMAVERFMKSCGLDRPEGTNEPLDHIATELEFLNYLCLVRSGAVQAARSIPQDAYEDFYENHFVSFAKRVGMLLEEHSREPLFNSIACVIAKLPDAAL